MRKDIIPVLKPYVDNDDLKSIKKTLMSGWWGKGPKVQELENYFSKLVGSKYAIAVNSNTTGIDLILKAIETNKQNNVISPTVSFVTTGIVPLWSNAKSVLVDVNEHDLNISTKSIKKNISSKTNAIISVNYAGIQSDIKGIKKIFKKTIIEDCAWSCYTPSAGKDSDVSVWSFQAVKTISCGDGGIITTNNKKLYEKIKKLSFFCIDKETYNRVQLNKEGKIKSKYNWDFSMSGVGYKAYMNDIQATLLLSQLLKIEKICEKRKKIQKKYNDKLHKYLTVPEWSETGGFYAARVKNPKDRDKLINYLAIYGIHSAVHYKPLHLHNILKQKNDNEFLIANKEWKKLISLPCFYDLKSSEQGFIIEKIKSFFS